MTIAQEQARKVNGRFGEQTFGRPQMSFDRPYSEDQGRLVTLGFEVSSDENLIENYSVEPAIWRQAVTPPDLRMVALSAGQQDAVKRAARILDDRRGRPESGSTAPWHRADCFSEPHGGTVVYIRSRPEPWAADTNSLRVLMDADGGVVDVREGVCDGSGPTVWNEL